MRTFNVDGLPGISIQGKKGNNGRPGNKTIIYSDEYKSKYDSSKQCLCYLVKTPWNLNDYNSILSDTTDKKKESFSKEYSVFISGINSLTPETSSSNVILQFSYDNEEDIDVYEYDYFLYPSVNSSELYIITSNIFDVKKDSSDSSTNELTGDKVLYIMLLWKIDDWKYVSGTSVLEKNDVKIEISETVKEYDGWEGTYFLDKNIPCLPAGTSDNYGKTVNTKDGHLFTSTVFDDNIKNSYIESMCNVLDKYASDLSKNPILTVRGTLYDIETGEPIPYFKNSLRIYTYSERGRKEAVEYSKAKNEVSTDDNGEFEIKLSEETDDFPYALITSNSRDDYPTNIKFFIKPDNTMYSEEDFNNVKFYLYRSDLYASIYKFDDFNKIDVFSAYNTSKFGVEDTSEEYSEDKIKELHKRNAKYVKFTYKSNLSDVENSKIKIEAEFVINDSQYAIPFTCYAKQWLTNETSSSLPTECLGGRYENFTNEFNFDSENLRDFTIIIKDYDQNLSNLPLVEVPEFIYKKYNIYIYMYYKDNGGASKKMLLNEDQIDIKLTS